MARSDHDDDDLDDVGFSVRSYVLTGGRTRAREGVGYDTLVRTVPGASTAGLPPEKVRIMELAAKPISAAELSAYIGIPIGVALILTSDLADEKRVRLHTSPKNSGTDVQLLRRLRNGISAL